MNNDIEWVVVYYNPNENKMIVKASSEEEAIMKVKLLGYKAIFGYRN
jgi:hypothetical protein